MVKYALVPMAALLLFTAPAHAQVVGALPFASVDGKLVLEAAGQKLTMPAPDFAGEDTSPEALSERISTRFVEESGQAHLEIYPRGEGEAFWTTVYGARLSNQANMSLADFRSTVINVYAQACRPETVALFQLEPDQEDMLPPIGYVCGAYQDGFEAFAGQGEVMLMAFYKSSRGLGMVYQEWRADAFDATDPTAWPIKPDAVEAHMEALKTQVSLSAAD